MNRISLVRDPAFFKRFFSIWSLLVLYNVITLGVNLADNVMIGGYDEMAMSGVSAVNQIQFIFMQLMLGASDAIVVLGSQYWGEKRPGEIKKFSAGALLFGAALSVLLFVCACVFPRQMVAVFTDKPVIQNFGIEYLAVMKYSYLLFAMTQLLLAVLRSVETVRIGFWVSLSTLVVNVSLNYLLIEGHWGAPELGVTGAAIATLAARAAELAIVVIYLLCIDRKLHWRPADLMHPDWVLIRDYLKLSRPFLLTSLMFGVAVALQTAILGHMDNPSAIAANSVASTLYQVLKVASVGAASAAAILIGTAIGSGEMHRIKSYAKTLQLMFLGIGLCTSLLLFVLRVPVLALYDLSPDTYRLANDFILVLCVTGFGTAYEMPTITGLIRGGGDAKFVFYNDLISIWGIVIPFSFLAAFVFKWSPVAVIACLNADQVFKCIPGAIKVNRYRWMKKLTRAETSAV